MKEHACCVAVHRIVKYREFPNSPKHELMIEYKDRAVRFGAMGMVGGLATLGLESYTTSVRIVIEARTSFSFPESLGECTKMVLSQAMWDASVLDQTAAATTEADQLHNQITNKTMTTIF